MPVAIISHPDCIQHIMASGHPERPSRLHAINDQLISSGVDFLCRQFDAPAVTREQLLMAHAADYIDFIYNSAPQAGVVELDADTVMVPSTLLAAEHAAGAGIMAVDKVLQGDFKRVFCAVRPPGHHAERNKAMGFCYFNNIAVATAYALQHYGLERIAIIDFDVHHGNGTEDIFRQQEKVLLCSSFQHPFYPFTNTTKSTKNIHYIPLAAGTKGSEFRSAMAQHCFPLVDQFKPQLIMISAGFDAHMEDEMSQLLLNDSDYYWVTTELVKLADQHAQGRIVSMLEGGYALSALGRAVAAHLKALIRE